MIFVADHRCPIALVCFSSFFSYFFKKNISLGWQKIWSLLPTTDSQLLPFTDSLGSTGAYQPINQIQGEPLDSIAELGITDKYSLDEYLLFWHSYDWRGRLTYFNVQKWQIDKKWFWADMKSILWSEVALFQNISIRIYNWIFLPHNFRHG